MASPGDTADNDSDRDSTRVHQIISEWIRRRERGESLSEEHFLSANPDIAVQLQAAFSRIRLIEAAHRQVELTAHAERPSSSRDSVVDDPVSTAASWSLTIRCPECHAQNSVPAEDALSSIVCGQCGGMFGLVHDGLNELSAGAAFGQFKIIRQLGRGGFGVVYEAQDTQLDRRVAIKVPRRGGLLSSETDQFLREARAAAQLLHPSIVSIYEVGRHNDLIYIVSEYVAGMSLAEWLDQELISAGEAASLCATIASALHHAHQQGVVHRDLKPANILLDRERQPHIADFGLARRATGETTLTLDGQLVGTPGYMSPEQARGDSHLADRRSDVYSLGVILFELLTGELPFRGNVSRVTRQIIDDDAPSPRKFCSTVPRDLETIALKCLEKDPDRRYQTARDLAEDLARFGRREPIAARPLSPPQRFGRWCRRRPALAANLFLLVLLGVVSSVVAAREYQQRLVAVARLREQREKLYAADMEAAMRMWNEASVPHVEQLLDRWRPAPGGKDLRGFEWYYLWRNCQRSRATATYDTQRNDDRFAKLAYLADDQHLAVFVGNQWILLHRDTARPVRSTTLQFNSDQITGHALSSDGATGAVFGVADARPFVRIWRFLPELRELSLETPAAAVQQLTFSPDGSLLVASCSDGAIRGWQSATGRLVHTIASAALGHKPTINGYRDNPLIAVSHDNTRLAVVTERTDVTLWSLPESRLLWNVPVDHQMCSALEFSHNDLWLAAGGWDLFVSLWRVADGALERTFKGHRDWINRVTFSLDDGLLASCSDDRTVRLWNVNSGAQLDEFVGHSESLFEVAIDRNRRALASHCAMDGLVRIWKVDETPQRTVLGTHDFIAYSVALAADERTLATGDDTGEVRIWDFRIGALLKSLHESDHKCLQLRYSPDGRWLVAVFQDGQLVVWDTVDWTLVPLATQLASGRHVVAFTPGGVLLTLGQDGLIHSWELRDFRASGSFRVAVEHPVAMALARDGGLLVTYHENGSLQLTDLASGKFLGALASDLNEVNSLEFNDDGRLIAAACADGTIRLWDTTRRRPHGVVIREQIAEADLTFLPGTRRLVTASIDGMIRLWDIDSCLCRGLLFKPGKNDFFGLATTADGLTIISVDGQCEVCRWRAASPQEVASVAPNDTVLRHELPIPPGATPGRRKSGPSGVAGHQADSTISGGVNSMHIWAGGG